jgi:Mg-chelatase subunit ChlD
MRNLVIKDSRLVQSKSSALDSSLRQMIAKKENESCYTLLLCDVSGSMNETARGERKIDTLARTVNRLVGENSCKLIAFSDKARNVRELRAKAGGMTNLPAALSLACQHRDASQIIVISDGYPTTGYKDLSQESLTEAHKIRCSISCVYIGPGEDEGYAFLCELAKQGNGKMTYTGNNAKQLERQVRLMLKS